MNVIDLRERICLQHCPYYKPSKKEELACRGFMVLEGFAKEGREIPFKQSDKLPDADTKKILKENLCNACPFYENDCDYAKDVKGAYPCGGFSLLGNLLEAQVVTVDNIINIQ